jgi:hypothetical protein
MSVPAENVYWFVLPTRVVAPMKFAQPVLPAPVTMPEHTPKAKSPVMVDPLLIRKSRPMRKRFHFSPQAIFRLNSPGPAKESRLSVRPSFMVTATMVAPDAAPLPLQPEPLVKLVMAPVA